MGLVHTFESSLMNNRTEIKRKEGIIGEDSIRVAPIHAHAGVRTNTTPIPSP